VEPSGASRFGTAKAALHAVAVDVREHYGLVLSGDDTTWRKIVAMQNAPREKRVLP